MKMKTKLEVKIVHKEMSVLKQECSKGELRTVRNSDTEDEMSD